MIYRKPTTCILEAQYFWDKENFDEVGSTDFPVLEQLDLCVNGERIDITKLVRSEFVNKLMAEIQDRHDETNNTA